MESWASHGVGSGHELQIVRISEECIELDEGALRRLLLNERVRDKPVAVVSVAGAFRTGKSFLLGFFLRYLQHSDRSSWLEDRDAPLRGFEWRAGCERHTTGILVWNEVFLQSPGKPFQKLLFLVRDWYHLSDAEYGNDGGRKILDRRLQISEHQPKQLQELRQYIHSCFTNIDCFLLPHPGTKVATGTSFDGRLSEIEEEFKEQLQNLVPSLLAPDNLTVKKINGEVLTCGEFHIYMKAYVGVFNRGELPEPMSVLQATARANNLAAVLKALKLYTTRMTQRCRGGKISAKRLRDYHNEERENALTKFQNIAKMGGDQFSQPYLDKLKQEIDEWFQDFMSRVALKSCLETNRSKTAQLGGAIVLSAGAGVSLAAGAHVAVPAVLVCGVLGLLITLAVTGLKGCVSGEKESRQMDERLRLVELHDELLDGPRGVPDESTRNVRRRQATPEANDFNTIDVEVVQPLGNNEVKRKGKKKNFIRRFFTKKRRNSRGPTELDRLKQC
ncbi:hypothetical protein MRX96_033773 [Rhipicephalus microplus]